MAFCIKCGAQNNEDIYFCPQCGTAVVRVPLQPQQIVVNQVPPQPISASTAVAQSTNKNSKLSHIALILGIIAFTILCPSIISGYPGLYEYYGRNLFYAMFGGDSHWIPFILVFLLTTTSFIFAICSKSKKILCFCLVPFINVLLTLINIIANEV